MLTCQGNGLLCGTWSWYLVQAIDTARVSLHHLFIYHRWFNARVTDLSTLEKKQLRLFCIEPSICCIPLLCVKLIFSGTILCYVRGEQLDKLCFSAGHLIKYWKECKIICTRNVCVSLYILRNKTLELELVPKTTRNREDSYPRHLVPSTSPIKNYSYFFRLPKLKQG